ncbi:TetR family transcriptional regulator [Spirillospora sp. CA-294931]|uniref:TetR family transcriptional regulator n=1 Tax=Spirillospora sp. CA-294931 TaxID=3240042 RepID=UPI003D8A6D59
MPYRRTPAVQARLDAQRQAVLDAAIALLSEKGYAGCTMAAVADRAGIATGSMYKHFPSKAALTVEVFRTVVTREVEAVAEAAQGPGDLNERIVAIVETFAGRALRNPLLSYALLAEPVDPAVDAERLVFRRAFRDLIAGRITEGIDAGLLPPQDAKLTAASLVGAVAEALVGPLSGESTDQETLQALTAFVTRALG